MSGGVSGAGGPRWPAEPPADEPAGSADAAAQQEAAHEAAKEAAPGAGGTWQAPSPDGEPRRYSGPAGLPYPGPGTGLYPGLPDLRIPGIGGLGLPPFEHQTSSRVRTEGRAALAGLKAAAEKNTTGPEAKLYRRIEAEMNDALCSIEADEKKAKDLPLGSPERNALEDQIDARERLFRNTLAAETIHTADEIKAKKGKDGVSGFKALLPPFLREWVEKGGVVIPGVPGSFRPRADDGILRGPTGVDWKVQF